MIAFEALSAAHGDSLLVHDGGLPPSFLWLIDGGPEGVLDGSIMKRLSQLTQPPKPPRVTWGMISHIDDDHINGIDRLLERLVAATQGYKPKPVTFDRFWFNSFSALVGGSVPSATGAAAAPQDIAIGLPPYLLGGDSDADAILQTVVQGDNVTANLRTLGLDGNPPTLDVISAPQTLPAPIDGATITILGPRKNRLDRLREAWKKAVATPDKQAREAALQELFLPARSLDRSIPNLSSIVVMAEFPGNRSMLLTGDARGDDIVAGWTDLNHGQTPVKPVSILKVPHHGSQRGITAAFLNAFPARHYVFSADGKYDNPDARVVEAVVTTQDTRDITLHFTNGDIAWKKPYKMETTGKIVQTLDELVDQLKKRPGSRATFAIRPVGALSVRIDLA
jgi:hypothetical protein